MFRFPRSPGLGYLGCAPQFGPSDKMQQHGFARNVDCEHCLLPLLPYVMVLRLRVHLFMQGSSQCSAIYGSVPGFKCHRVLTCTL